MSSISDKVNELATLRSAKRLEFPPIGRAPFMLRYSKEEYFKPRAVAFGPIHHSNPEYIQGEEFKQILATKFISESGSQNLTLFGAVKDNIGPLRNRYELVETEKYTDDELALILLIDGCAVLQYIQSVVGNTLASMVKNNLPAFAVHDLFLLENQLPFDLLELLMDRHKGGGKQKFMKLIRVFINYYAFFKIRQEWEVPSETNHLLHLLRERMLHHPNDIVFTRSYSPKTTGGDLSRATSSSSDTNDSLEHISITLHEDETENQGASHQKGSEAEYSLSIPQIFPNVMDMKAAGIHVKPSETNCLRDFAYEEGKLWYGTLRMPRIWVHDSTLPIFLNMIAYEQHPEFENKGEVSAYICLMNLLIDDADDVKELRRAKILYNMLGSDKYVAGVFKTISTNLVPILLTYKDLLKKIQKHNDTEWKTTVAQGIHYRFSTPWTTLAFVGLILAFIQALSGFIN